MEGLNEVGWSVTIGENASLVSLQGLDNLYSVGKNFSLSMNPQLATVASLNSLNSVDGYFYVQSQSSLVSLDGLENLNRVNGSLNISLNSILNNIDAIKNIDAAAMTELQIYLNPNLMQCAVQSVCDFFDIQPSNANINTNGMDCNSVEEVQTACALSIANNHFSEPRIYPNPTYNTFEISGVDEGKLDIIDSQGRTVISMNIGEKEYSTTSLSPGVYFLKISSENLSLTKRLIKI